MKASPSTVAALTAAITPLDTPARRASYANVTAVKSIDRRYRWDLLWTVLRSSTVPWSTVDGLTDAHIDTALRSIVAPMGDAS